MLSYSDLKKGVLFVRDGKAYEVVESSFSRMQQRKAVVSAKIRDLANGKVVEQTFQPSDYFEEADVIKRPLTFLYRHRDDFVFTAADVERDFSAKSPGDRVPPPQRFTLKENNVGHAARWLKPNTEITAVFFNDALLTFSVPIKMDLKVTEAPPGIQGDRSQGGTKSVTLETGAMIQTPLFINTGDTIRVNTETGDYVERVSKQSL
ncbi:MAG: hypothetical protein WAP52_03240 [Candidatus Sungiibacteriota bacterium]